MARKALFEGLVFDEYENPAQVAYVGSDPCYVVNDAGFLRHIPSEQVDRQVLENLEELIAGSEGAISEQAAQMLGQDDIFTRAMIANQLKNIGQQFEALMEVGIPEETRAYLGMMGFRIRIDVHGEVLDVEQPGMSAPEEE